MISTRQKTVRLWGSTYFGYAFNKDFFSFLIWNRRKLYEVQWFRGERIRAFMLPFGEYRLTLEGQLKAREVLNGHVKAKEASA